MPIRRISKEEAAQNRKKQQVLRDAGYNVKIDGSWGPWQEDQYKKVISNRRQSTKANAGALAIPAASYALKGLGVSLPSILSGPALAASAPLSLVLAGPISGVVDLATGQHRSSPMTSQQRQEKVYAPDATRVASPISDTREITINPALVRQWTANMATVDPDGTIHFDTETSTENTNSSTETPNGDNKQNKKGLKDRIRNIIRRKKNPTSQQTSQNENTSEKFAKGLKTAYKWSWYVPTAIDVVGNAVGAARNVNTYSPSFPALEGRTALIRGGLNWLGRKYNPQATDSVKTVSTAIPVSTAKVQDSIPTQDSIIIDFNQDYKW